MRYQHYPQNSIQAGNHALVLGSSMAGLCAARVLSNYFKQVTLVERDLLSEAVENRKGVPQGQHLHVLLAKGEQILARFFPGLCSELLSSGAVCVDHQQDILWHQGGDYSPASQVRSSELLAGDLFSSRRASLTLFQRLQASQPRGHSLPLLNRRKHVHR